MGEFCFNHFPAKLSFTPWSPEPSECLPVNLKDQIYSLCKKVNTHTQTQLYIYFIRLNMKYTFYRCFTRFPSVHGSPKTCVPKGHLPWARVHGNEMQHLYAGHLCICCRAVCVAGRGYLVYFSWETEQKLTQHPLHPSRPGIYVSMWCNTATEIRHSFLHIKMKLGPTSQVSVNGKSRVMKFSFPS